MEQPNLKILTPCYMGQVSSAYLHSITNFFPYSMEHGILFSLETLPNCSLISLGRSLMLHRALADPEWTHVLWIDADLRFRPEYIHMMILDDKDIVGGLYPKKGLPIDFASSPTSGGEETDEVFETPYVATGFMLVKRAVIEKMNDHYREELTISYQGVDNAVHLFHPIIDKDNHDLFLTEDYAFCRRAIETGHRCFMSKKFELPHTGVFEYSVQSENQSLREYERRGRVSLNDTSFSQYFSSVIPR